MPSFAGESGKGWFSKMLTTATFAHHSPSPELGEFCKGNKSSSSMRKPCCQAMAGSLLVLGSPEQPPKCQKYLQNFFLECSSFALYFSCPATQWIGGSGCKTTWVTIGLDQKHLCLVRAHLTLQKVMKRGCVHVCEVKNTVKDSSFINPHS